MKRVKHSADFQIYQPVEILFPLFSPEGEKLWVPGWNYKSVTGSADLHEDFIFLTENHDHAASDAIWLVKRYEPGEYLIEFYKVEPDNKVGIITVKCFAVSQAKANVNVTYEYIALSEKGAEFVSGFTIGEYESFIAEWQQLLEAYFARQ